MKRTTFHLVYNFMTIDAMQIGALARKLRYDRAFVHDIQQLNALTQDSRRKVVLLHCCYLGTSSLSQRHPFDLSPRRSTWARCQTTSQPHHPHPLRPPHTLRTLSQTPTSSHNSTTSSPTTSVSLTPTAPSAPASRPTSAPASCPSPTPIETLRLHSVQDDAMGPQSLTAG